jgi:hypothetical protein
MASIINASSTGSGGIVQTADASGVLQLQSNGTVALTVSGSTVTFVSAPSLPAGSITQAMLATNVAGNGPAFGAYQSTAQALSSGVFTKILFQTEEFDTNNNFASSTFTPTVAGYYQLNGRFRVSTSLANSGLSIYKNGVQFKDGVYVDGTAVGMQVNCLVYANGTTDYFEMYGYFSVAQNTTASQAATWFNGFLARAA